MIHLDNIINYDQDMINYIFFQNHDYSNIEMNKSKIIFNSFSRKTIMKIKYKTRYLYNKFN